MTLAELLQDASRAVADHWQTLLFASAILLLLYFFVSYRSVNAWYGDIPGPKPLPVLGHIIDTVKHRGQLHLQVHEYFLRYGKVFAMSSFLGKIPNLVVADPDMLKDIFVKEFDCFRDRPLIIRPPEPLASMLTRAQGEKWKRIRGTVTPAFSALKMKQMLSVMNACCDTLLRKLSEVADKEQSVNIVKFQQTLTMDLILSAVFGLQANSQDNPDDPIINAARQALKQSFSKKILLGSALPFGTKIMEKFPNIWLSNAIPLLKMTEKIISAKKAGSGNSARKDMLDLMLAASDDPSVPESKKLSDTEVLAQSIIFLAAGYETSSGTLSLTSYHIATNPEVQDKLQQEIDSAWTDEEQVPTYETMNKLPYLDMVICETLRLYPPGTMISRCCNKACVIKGIKIPKDSPIIIPAYSVQRDPAIFPDPEKFDPERFSPAAKQSRNPYSFLPFGHGPHSCIGMRFAQMQIRLVLARMLRKYRLEVGPDTKIPPDVKMKATLASPEINLRVVSRTRKT